MSGVIEVECMQPGWAASPGTMFPVRNHQPWGRMARSVNLR
jgi:hypothetical protein